MDSRHSDNDGSDIFWPGYVDATTNLILNLLFLLTILIVAVFMFALELGRTSPGGTPEIPITSTAPPTEIVPPTTTDPIKEADTLKLEIERLEKLLEQLNATELDATGTSEATTAENIALKLEIERLKTLLEQLTATEQVATGASEATTAENLTLKLEIQRLKEMLAQLGSQKAQSGGPEKSVEATSSEPKPQEGLDKAIASDMEVIVHFKDDAIAFTPTEHKELLESLQQIVATGEATIYVEVPTGFSEAKRMGFYRAMAVRNLLIEMELSTEKINVSVVEGPSKANASKVRVRAH